MKFKPEPSEKESIKDMLQKARQENIEEKKEQKALIYNNKERNKMKLELGKKRKAKGPNPLSCKKKKKSELETEVKRSESFKKTRRSRKKSLGSISNPDT